MNEQRPPTSPGLHPTGQPQRVVPAQPHVSHPVHAPHAPHAPHAAHAAHHPVGAQAAAGQRAAPVTASLPVDDDLVVLDDAITLDDDAETRAPAPAATPGNTATSSVAPVTSTPKKITFGNENLIRSHQWKRKPHLGGQGACRVKTFHGKCSDQGLEYLDDAINVFLDEHPEIEVKFVQSNIGMFDGKFKDFALIVNIWY